MPNQVPPFPTLSQRLRTETADLHRQAERAGIMPLILSGRADRRSYLALLGGLLPVYQALERSLEALRHHPAVAPVYFPELFRVPGLTRDLADLGESAPPPRPGPAALEYAARIAAVATTEPPRLVAHTYVRYLGDLSGGQVLARLVAKQLGLDGRRGTAFYDFSHLEDLEGFKTRFRAALDGLPPGPGGADAIVAEARLGFELNTRLFREISPDPEISPSGSASAG